MDREDAISTLKAQGAMVASEFATFTVSDEEIIGVNKEALLALGVTEEEYDCA